MTIKELEQKLDNPREDFQNPTNGLLNAIGLILIEILKRLESNPMFKAKP